MLIIRENYKALRFVLPEGFKDEIMPIPDFQPVMCPILEVDHDGGPLMLAEVRRRADQRFPLVVLGW